MSAQLAAMQMTKDITGFRFIGAVIARLIIIVVNSTLFADYHNRIYIVQSINSCLETACFFDN